MLKALRVPFPLLFSQNSLKCNVWQIHQLYYMYVLQYCRNAGLWLVCRYSQSSRSWQSWCWPDTCIPSEKILKQGHTVHATWALSTLLLVFSLIFFYSLRIWFVLVIFFHTLIRRWVSNNHIHSERHHMRRWLMWWRAVHVWWTGDKRTESIDKLCTQDIFLQTPEG